MKTTFKVILGMGPPIPELGEKDMTICSDSKYVLTSVTQPTHSFFCVYWKLEKDLFWPRQPRYTTEEMEALAESVADHPISDTILFGEVWKKRHRATLINLEEGVLEHWHHGRIVLVGDSVHKVESTPSITISSNLRSVDSLCTDKCPIYPDATKYRPGW